MRESNLVRNDGLRLMMPRLGAFHQNEDYKKPQPHHEPLKIEKQIIDGLEDQSLRLKANGGYTQQERMIFDKRRSLDRSLNYSYQAANIRKVGEEKVDRALINPDKNKFDYDDKIVSVHYEAGYESGDVFEWLGTDTYWIISLQDIDELAYFRGEIRRCRYTIAWEDENGIQSAYAAVRGPVETKINFIQKHQISVDEPNYSLHILMPLTDAIIKYFQRYSKFYLQGCPEVAPQICWRVEATDWISTPGIFELTAVEYYSNKTEDDVNAGLVGTLKAKSVDPNPDEVKEFIEGETFIKPKKVYTYKFNGLATAKWKVQKDRPIKYSIDQKDSTIIYIMWEGTQSGQFDITYGNLTKTIVVESLF